MGNTISSIKTVVVNSIKGVFSGYREFADRCFKYYFKCPSYPLVEDIVNNGVILPCQVVVLLPEIIYGISMDAYETIKNHPEETVVFLGSHYYTVFILEVPAFRLGYICVMGGLNLVYYTVRYLVFNWDEHMAIYNSLPEPWDPPYTGLSRQQIANGVNPAGPGAKYCNTGYEQANFGYRIMKY